MVQTQQKCENIQSDDTNQSMYGILMIRNLQNEQNNTGRHRDDMHALTKMPYKVIMPRYNYIRSHI